MQRYAVIEKSVGETPLQAIERFRDRDGALAEVPLAYAGRLDPMASGSLLVLIGDECKRQHDYYNKLDKEYEFEILLGVETDTGDVLGLPERCDTPDALSETKIRRNLSSFVGSVSLPYPVYSSKTVNGKPLFQHAYDGTLGEIDIPMAHTHIYALSLEETHTLSKDELASYVHSKLNSLQLSKERKWKGDDFRLPDIQARWQSFEKKDTSGEYLVLRCRAIVSSGTYVRSLAPAIAQELGACGLALSIHRTRIGRYQKILGSFGWWRATYE